jgi:hypothetical protein
LAAVAGVRRVTPELDAAYHIGPIDVLEWTRSPGFKITRAVRLQEGSRRLVKVYFEYDRSDQDGRWAEGAGWVSFRPDDCWTVDAYDERSGSPNPFGAPPNSKAGKGPVLDIFINQRTVHYRGKEKGVPVVESLETTRNHVGAWKARETVRVTEIQFDAPPDETFDLASYDAEPPAKEEDLFATITRWLVRAVWVCSAGVVIAAVPAMVRRVVGKKGERMTG